MAVRHTAKQNKKTRKAMNKKLLGILPAFLIFAVVSNAQEKKDTVKVNQTIFVDTVLVKNSDKNISVKGNADTVVVKLGKKGIYVYEDKAGDVSVWTSRERNDRKFHSHLDGLGLGINTYFNSNGGTSIPVGPKGERYDLMNLNNSKSINVILNITSVTQPISRYVGLTAGIGTEWHNYRFDNDITLVKEDGRVNVKELSSFQEYNGKHIRKTKLTDWWLDVPVAIEFNGGKYRSMYASVGVVGSLLLNSHTKIVVDDHGKQKDKVWNEFYLNPFRASLMAKFGYHDWGIYATYSLTQMFQDGKGPELYPFAAGVTFNF
jgi:hypothetical protein